MIYISVCTRSVPASHRRAAGEELVPRARAARSAGEGTCQLPEAAQVLRTKRSQTQITQASEEKVRDLIPSYVLYVQQKNKNFIIKKN